MNVHVYQTWREALSKILEHSHKYTVKLLEAVNSSYVQLNRWKCFEHKLKHLENASSIILSTFLIKQHKTFFGPYELDYCYIL